MILLPRRIRLAFQLELFLNLALNSNGVRLRSRLATSRTTSIHQTISGTIRGVVMPDRDGA